MRPWFLLTILAVVSWGVWAVIAKATGGALSPVLSQALSTLGLLPVSVALCFSKRLEAKGKRSRGVLFAFGAGIISSLGNIAYYDILGQGGKATTVIPLTAMYPLVTIFLAIVLLKERLNKVQRVGVGLSLAAIYLFNVRQEGGFLSAWLLVALIPILLWGVSGLLQKVATNHISSELCALSFFLAFVVMSICILLQQRLPAVISARDWSLVAGLGLSLGLGYLAILAAFAKDGKAAVISPLGGLYPLVSIPVAMSFFGERVGLRESVGVILALVAVAALAFEPSEPAPSATEKSATTPL